MQASYTCLRCQRISGFQSLSKRSIRLAKPKDYRLLTTSRLSPRKNSIRHAIRARHPREASSLAQHAQSSDIGSPEIRTPPGLASTSYPGGPDRVLLKPDNLFHSYSNSPSPEIRRRAAFMKQNAYCPHPSHHQTRMPIAPGDPEARKTQETASQPPAHLRFECPDCGIPVSCSEEHWADDYESHLEICDTLRQINEDDHDLRSGRFFPEFEYPGPQLEEVLVNLTSWDTFLYTREFKAINEERSMRQATRLLTYPITIGSVLHELSPYSIRKSGRLTTEGLKSFTGKLKWFERLKFSLIASSPSIYSSSSTHGWRHRYQRPPSKFSCCPHLHTWSTRRIFIATRSVGSAITYVSSSSSTPDLHWTGKHVK